MVIYECEVIIHQAQSLREASIKSGPCPLRSPHRLSGPKQLFKPSEMSRATNRYEASEPKGIISGTIEAK